MCQQTGDWPQQALGTVVWSVTILLHSSWSASTVADSSAEALTAYSLLQSRISTVHSALWASINGEWMKATQCYQSGGSYL